MNNIKIFENKEFGSVRTITIDSEPWFVGKDICTVFGDKNHSRSLGRVDSYDKKIISLETNGGKQNLIAVNESGLYALLFSMQPQKAHNEGVSDEYPLKIQERINKLHKFKHWVTSEVLPSIRKHGAYITPEKLDEILSDPDTMIRLLQNLKEEREKVSKLKAENAVQSQQISELQPKASYYDLVLNCKDLMSISKIAKDYGWSATRMNTFLHEKGVQYKQGDMWLLYQKYVEKGYTSTKTHTYNGSDGEIHSKIHMYWTQKGRLFIYDLLKGNGILPLIEAS